jgi:hypothetical protein
MSLRLRGRAVTNATFYSPDTPEPVTCEVQATADGTSIAIPGGSMNMYGLLKIETPETPATGGAQ